MKTLSPKPENRRELEAFLQHEDDKESLLAAFDQLSPEAVSQAEIDSAWKKVAAKTVAAKPAPILRFVRFIGAAAAAVAVAFLGYYFAKERTSEAVFASADIAREIALPDGSRVILSPRSSIKTNIQPEKREVLLSGEAFFDVAHGKIPFIVEAAGTEVTVLGTQFRVTSGKLVGDQEAAYSTVALVEGTVKVSFPALAAEETLIPGQATILMGTKIEKRNINPAHITAWQRGRLSFDNEPLRLIFSEIQRMYGVTINVEGNVNLDERVSLFRRRPEQADSVLFEIAAVKALQIQFKNDTFVVSR